VAIEVELSLMDILNKNQQKPTKKALMVECALIRQSILDVAVMTRSINRIGSDSKALCKQRYEKKIKLRKKAAIEIFIC